MRKAFPLSVALMLVCSAVVISAAAAEETGPGEQPRPASVAVAGDLDFDGVADDVDICPRTPNPPPSPGASQPDRCSDAFMANKDRYVFLHNRVFEAPEGVAVAPGEPGERKHMFLHVVPRPSRVAVLTLEEENQLEALGVTVLDSLDENAFLASAPANGSALDSIVRLPFVVGLSEIQPEDKIIDPELRWLGGQGPSPRQSIEVEFFEDTTESERSAALSAVGARVVESDEEAFLAELPGSAAIGRLAAFDTVVAITRSEATEDFTDQARQWADIDPVDEVLEFLGDGITLAMIESNTPCELANSSFDNRLTNENHKKGKPCDHAREVAAIMIAGEFPRGDPVIRGIQPQSNLYASYSKSKRYNGYRWPKAARDVGAVVVNNSSGSPIRCRSLPGRYGLYGRSADKAIRKHFVSIVDAAANGRGTAGDWGAVGCPYDAMSLRRFVPKNSIVVSNLDVEALPDATVLDLNHLSETSSWGPTQDGRLKPDITAPGNGVHTITVEIDPSTGQLAETIYTESDGGTSFSAPVVSASIGILGQAFEQLSMSALDVPPSTYKAILLNTAEDILPTGPDHASGFGLLNAREAVRTINQNLFWEDEARENGSTVSISFDITQPRTELNVTLAWTDPEASTLIGPRTVHLRNNLDLWLVDPNGDEYYIWDTGIDVAKLTPQQITAAVEQGHGRCKRRECDERNNVEQVTAVPGARQRFLPEGKWNAVVKPRKFKKGHTQPFSVSVSPACPVVITETTVLTGDIKCQNDGLLEAAVMIDSDFVSLDCDGHSITAVTKNPEFYSTHRFTGIKSARSNAYIANCLVDGFDVGIDLRGRHGRVVASTVRNSTEIGIRATGQEHIVGMPGGGENTVVVDDGIGIYADSTVSRIQYNVIIDNAEEYNTTGIFVGSALTTAGLPLSITQNNLGGLDKAIVLDSPSSAYGATVTENVIEPARSKGIVLRGNLANVTIKNNTVFMDGGTGIEIARKHDLVPDNNMIDDNFISGATATAIQLEGATHTTIRNMTLSNVPWAVFEKDTENTLIKDSVINPFDLGIFSDGSLSSEFRNNTIRATRGVVLQGKVYGTPDAPLRIIGNAFQVGDRGTGLDAAFATIDHAEISGNHFEWLGGRRNGLFAEFLNLQDATGNQWDDIGINNLQIYDVDSDGNADCGADHPYGSTGNANVVNLEDREAKTPHTRTVCPP